MNFYDDTNTGNAYQGNLRFAPLDVVELRGRCAKDAGTSPFKLVLTHCDQFPAPGEADLYSTGPTRQDVKHGLINTPRRGNLWVIAALFRSQLILVR